MPELAAIGLVGSVFTFILVNLNLYWVHRTFQSPALLTLNHNLSKVNRWWSVEQGSLLDVQSGKELEELRVLDYRKSTRAAFLFGTLMIFLSWFGLVFFSIYLFSVHKFAKSRLEERIFDSALVKDSSLESSRVANLLQELESRGR